MRTGDPARGGEQDGKEKKEKGKKGIEKNEEKETKKQDGHGDMMGQTCMRRTERGEGCVERTFVSAKPARSGAKKREKKKN